MMMAGRQRGTEISKHINKQPSTNLVSCVGRRQTAVPDKVTMMTAREGNFRFSRISITINGTSNVKELKHRVEANEPDTLNDAGSGTMCCAIYMPL